jgi:hypothetical protein
VLHGENIELEFPLVVKEDSSPMAIEIKCDVEGCNSRAPFSMNATMAIGIMPGDQVPKGWFMVMIPLTDIEEQRYQKDIEEKVNQKMEMFPGPIPNMIARRAISIPPPPRRVFCCEKHNMPVFSQKSSNDSFDEITNF